MNSYVINIPRDMDDTQLSNFGFKELLQRYIYIYITTRVQAADVKTVRGTSEENDA